MADLIDRAAHALQARRTFGLSPASLGLAAADWWTHLLASPGKRMELASEAARMAASYGNYLTQALAHHRGEPDPACCVQAEDRDRRFVHPDWQRFPFNLLQQAFLLQQQWWQQATTGVRGVSRHHEQVVSFAARQMLDALAPNNLPATNPEVLDLTLQSGGVNLLKGFNIWRDDLQRMASGAPPAGSEDFVPGRQVALTPGKVVMRNRLVELIQYEPSTPAVHPEPVLIVPAWIMKYYILDLSPHNSLVRYLVDQGHTVFMISWRNPTGEDRDLGMRDYLELGPLAALDAVRRIRPHAQVHGVGYCLGGTLLSIAAAALGARGDRRLGTLTLLASQVDFSEPGELSLFIDDSQVSFLEDMMWAQGYLDTTQMAGAFQMLRSYDLISSRVTREYLMGQRRPPNDLMAWNADATRMPYRMHSEYLRGMYLNNDLAEGRWRVDGQALSVENAPQPWFVVGTETDHVAPWRSVYKIHLLAHSDIDFVLTSGGHNAGIVSEPGHAGRHYRWARRAAGQPYLGPEHWLTQAEAEAGSWWPRWSRWLAAHSSAPAAPPRMGLPGTSPLGDAPGSYVLQR
ncbi:MAG: alpha/beta fold hydrolase [Betaproteobacteria bacterium]|nr:alpha/beta fold hydrolase [Betaproteobacteria bacterium]